MTNNEDFDYSEEKFESDKTTLGDRIEAARRAKEMSREDLAQRLGVKKSTIKKWENDQSEPRSNRLYMMGGVLDCHVMWLLNGEGDSPMDTLEDGSDAKIGLLKAELSELEKSVQMISQRIKAISAQL